MSHFTPPTPEEREERLRLLALPFRMVIQDVFVWKGRGVIVTGRAESGMLKRGDSVLIVGDGKTIQSSVAAFEGFIRDLDSFVGEAGDNLGFFLRDVEKDQLAPGMIVTTEGL